MSNYILVGALCAVVGAFSGFMIHFYRTKGNLSVDGKFTKNGYLTMFFAFLLFASGAMLAYVPFYKSNYDKQQNEWKEQQKELKEEQTKYDNSLDKEFDLLWNNRINVPIRFFSLQLFSDNEISLEFVSKLLANISLEFKIIDFNKESFYEVSFKENNKKNSVEKYDLSFMKNDKKINAFDKNIFEFYMKHPLNSMPTVKSKQGMRINSSFFYIDDEVVWINPSQKLNVLYILQPLKEKYSFKISDLYNATFYLTLPREMDTFKDYTFVTTFYNKNNQYVAMFDFKDVTSTKMKTSTKDISKYSLSGVDVYNYLYNTSKKIYKAQKKIDNKVYTDSDYDFLYSLGLAPNKR